MNTEKTNQGKYFNKTTLNKSLYSNFLSGTKVVPNRYDSLSSKRKYLESQHGSKKQYTFTITPSDTDIKISKTIYELTNTQESNLLDWIDEFREIATINA
ncbi:hypothetical protein H311_03422 [Anncaliia algerae PRA109]|nr:hypothetical protein H311_03422 [Anncaliia algerae PRA109]